VSAPAFKRAVRHQARLRIGLAGPSGSGKTYGALLIAKGLGGRTCVIDTERGSASLYSDLLEYDTMELGPPFTPERFIEALAAAARAEYANCILDSITHEWNGEGGLLEIVDNVNSSSRSGNKFAAWKDASPRHQRFISAMLQSPLNIIATVRTKAAYVLETASNGKQVPRKVGMAPEQRDGVEYEFTTVLDLSTERNMASASKDRSGLFHDPFVITEATGVMLRDWLAQGEAAAAAAPAQSATLDESKVADHMAAIDDADTPESLRLAFKAAWRAAGDVSDSATQARFKRAYDDRLAALAEATA
jgi:hypothetical protein